jgi:hypothetical protein
MLKYIFTSEENWTGHAVSLADRYFKRLTLSKKFKN